MAREDSAVQEIILDEKNASKEKLDDGEISNEEYQEQQEYLDSDKYLHSLINSGEVDESYKEKMEVINNELQ